MNVVKIFHCPCGECSLEEYLKESCPQGFFPYLELSKLNEDEREDVIQKLSYDTAEMIDCFADILDGTCYSLKERGVTPKELARRVLELGAYESPKVHKPLLSEEVVILKNSETIDDSFLILQPHMSFFNYELLEHIIKGRRTGSDEDRRQMEEYRKKLKLYCRRRVFEVPPGAVGQSSTDLEGSRRVPFAVLTKKDEPEPNLTLDDIKVVERKIANILGLKSSTLYLHRIDKGCLILVFSVPEFVARELFPLDPSLVVAIKEEGFLLLTASDSEAVDSQVQNVEKGM